MAYIDGNEILFSAEINVVEGTGYFATKEELNEAIESVESKQFVPITSPLHLYGTDPNGDTCGYKIADAPVGQAGSDDIVDIGILAQSLTPYAEKTDFDEFREGYDNVAKEFYEHKQSYEATVDSMGVSFSNVATMAQGASDTAEEALSIAKGANQAISFTNLNALISAMNKYGKDKLNVGQSIFIATKDVPDVWVYGINAQNSQYESGAGDKMASDLKDGKFVAVGWYILSPLETLKVNLTEYVKREELETLDETFENFADYASMTYVTHSHLDEKLLDKQDKLEFADAVSGDVDRNLIPTVGAVNDAFNTLAGDVLPNGYATKEELETLDKTFENFADYVDKTKATKEELNEAIGRIEGGTGGGTTPTQKTWEKIVDYTVKDGDTSPYSFDGFEITEFQAKILYQDATITTNTSVNIAVSIKSGTSPTNRGLGKFDVTNFTTGGRFATLKYVSFGENEGGLLLSSGNFSASTGVYPSVSAEGNKALYIPSKTSENENIYYYNSFKAIALSLSVPLQAGDKIEIWGVKK